MSALKLETLDGSYSIHRFQHSAEIPAAVLKSEFYNITRTDDELSIVCKSEIELKGNLCDSGWSCIRIAGVLDFALTGILAKLSDILAKAGIPIFAISTYNTDYILVKSDKLNSAIAALKESGYLFIPLPGIAYPQ